MKIKNILRALNLIVFSGLMGCCRIVTDPYGDVLNLSFTAEDVQCVTRITVGGCRPTSQAARDYLIYLAAEIGLEKHKAYFSLHDSVTDAVRGLKLKKPVVLIVEGTPQAFAYASYHDVKESNDFSVNDVLARGMGSQQIVSYGLFGQSTRPMIQAIN